MDNNYGPINENGTNKNGDNTPSIVSMVLGILSIILCWLPIIGLILGIIAVVLATKGMKIANEVNKGKGFAIAGISCGATGIVLNVIYSLMWLFMGFIFKMTYDELNNYDYNTTYNRSYNSSYNRTYDYNDVNSILNSYKY